MNHRLTYSHGEGGIPLAEITVDGAYYQFGLFAVEEEYRLWLTDVVAKQMQEIYGRAYFKGKNEIRKSIADILREE